MSVDVVQLIQMVTAVDVDEPQGGQQFSYSLAPEVANNPNFTLRDNQGTERSRRLTGTSAKMHIRIISDQDGISCLIAHSLPIAAPSGQPVSLHHKTLYSRLRLCVVAVDPNKYDL